MYTVFTEDGKPKHNRFGLVIFVRTLSEARDNVDPGDRIVAWSSSGSPRTTWVCGPDHKVRVMPRTR